MLSKERARATPRVLARTKARAHRLQIHSANSACVCASIERAVARLTRAPAPANARTVATPSIVAAKFE